LNYLRDGSKEFILKERAPKNFTSHLEANFMKLNYRGVSYEYNPPVVAVTEGEIAGKFRGLDWRFRNLEKPPVLQPPLNMTYRGVTYNNRPTVDSEMAESKVKSLSRWLILHQEKVAKNRTASMLSRTSHEIGI
jgi:Domain of unknown function (DUF4278)